MSDKTKEAETVSETEKEVIKDLGEIKPQDSKALIDSLRAKSSVDEWAALVESHKNEYAKAFAAGKTEGYKEGETESKKEFAEQLEELERENLLIPCGPEMVEYTNKLIRDRMANDLTPESSERMCHMRMISSLIIV